jgi:hypothetical protein
MPAPLSRAVVCEGPDDLIVLRELIKRLHSAELPVIEDKRQNGPRKAHFHLRRTSRD